MKNRSMFVGLKINPDTFLAYAIEFGCVGGMKEGL